MSLDVAKARSCFPSLSAQPPYIYADNAGGSQCSKQAIDRIVDYLSNSNVQPSTDYSVSRTTVERVGLGKEAARVLFDAAGADEIALGPSSTMLMENLARAIEGDLGDRDEIIVTDEHEGRGISHTLVSPTERSFHSECRAMEEARGAERVEVELLARNSGTGFE